MYGLSGDVRTWLLNVHQTDKKPDLPPTPDKRPAKPKLRLVHSGNLILAERAVVNK